MTYITNNILLNTNKLIKPYQCAMIATEGPTIKGKLNLEGLEIQYESFYVSQLTLNENAKNQPLYYGFLGQEVTFLMIKATYIPLDANYAIEDDQYLEYYFADDPSQIRYMNKLMILTGNVNNHRIPQIYLNNPSTEFKVYLDIMVANLSQDDITYAVTTSASYTGLYYNSIISDKYTYTAYSPCSGSSELYVIDTEDVVLTTIPYNKIHTITKQSDGLTLIIGLDTEEKISLEFLSEFNLNQANSRINWVLKDKHNRVLDKSYIYTCNVQEDGLDVTDPVITFNSGVSWSGTTIYSYTTGTTITKTDLINYFISGVTDNRDGDINKYNVQVTIREIDNLVPFTAITYEGMYDVEFSISDIAGNTKSVICDLVVDVTGPEIIFYNFVSGVTLFTMSISGDTMDSSGITYSDIKLFTVEDVYDAVDYNLTIGDVEIIVTPTGNTYITITGGTYIVDYTLTDFVGLTFTTGKTMTVIT